MAGRAQEVVVEVEGRRLALSRLEKVLYPATGFTKAEVIDYYARIAPVLVPHLKGRPLTLKRYPDGVDGPYFHQKQSPDPRPEWMRTVEVWSEHSSRAIHYCVADDLATLVWLANLANLELHPFLHRAEDLSRPTAVAFDLDPGPDVGLVECARVALRLRSHLSDAGLEAYPKTSGSKGMQVYVPLNTKVTYEETKTFARAVAQNLEAAHRDAITSNMRKDLRKGRVFIDWSQNDEHKTTVCVYSLRARERPSVSTPLDWKAVETVAKTGRAKSLQFTPADVLERVGRLGDLFRPVLKQRQRLPLAPRRGARTPRTAARVAVRPVPRPASARRQ
jgi:bifunctional non-homologous end joining protein LigD